MDEINKLKEVVDTDSKTALAKTLALASLGRLTTAICCLAVSLTYGGFVTMVLWNGIINPIFGLTTLKLAQGIGLDLFVSFIVARKPNSGKVKSAPALLGQTLGVTTMYLLVGLVIMLFI